MSSIKKIKWLLAAMGLAASSASTAIDFKDPNTSFFSIENYTYLNNSGKVDNFRAAGYYTPPKGAVPAKVSMLPRINIEQDKLVVINTSGNKVKISSVSNVNNVDVIQVPLSYTGALPYDQQGAAISSRVNGTPLQNFRPIALVNESMNNEPIIFQPAQFGPIGQAVRDDTKRYMDSLADQKKFLDSWKAMKVETASIEGLELQLKIDNEVVAERSLPGSAILSSGKLPNLIVKQPDLKTFNRIKGGTYEVEVKYSFKDAQVSSIVASYDFSQIMTQYIEQTRSVATSSSSSGWKIFNIGSRRTKVKQSINESSQQNSTYDSQTNTIIEIEDADDDMIFQFENEFFPGLTQQQAIKAHQDAAAELKTTNPELAKAHLDYANAIVQADGNKSFDAIGAAAALGSGNYAMFIAKGVQFHNNGYKQNSSFRRVLSANVQEGQSKNWVSTKTRTVKRKVTVLLSPDENSEYSAWIGMCDARPYAGVYQFQQHTFLLPTCIMAGGPMHQAGILPGMLIVNINGRRIANRDDLVDLLEDYEPGDEVRVNVLHPQNPNSTQTYYVTLAKGVIKTGDN